MQRWAKQSLPLWWTIGCHNSILAPVILLVQMMKHLLLVAARHVVEALAGWDAVAATDLGPIAGVAPSALQPPPEAIAAAAAQGDPGPEGLWPARGAALQPGPDAGSAVGAELGPNPSPSPQQSGESSAAPGTGGKAARSGGLWLGGGQDEDGAPSCRVFGDRVDRFNEVAAARGALGRFPGSEVMPLLRQFASTVS